MPATPNQEKGECTEIFRCDKLSFVERAARSLKKANKRYQEELATEKMRHWQVGSSTVSDTIELCMIDKGYREQVSPQQQRLESQS